MKRGLYVLLCASLLVACSQQEFESQEIVIEPQSSEEFNAVLNSIASLNDKYGCDEISTRSDLRGFFRELADYVGGFYGGYLGAECDAYVAGSTGSVGFGAFIGSALTMLGGMSGSVVASYIFDLLWPVKENGGSVVIQPNPFFDSFAYCPIEGSSGSVHNTILYALQNNGKSYIDGDGNVLVEEMFRDALEYEENLHLDGVVNNFDYINEIESFCIDLYAAIRDARSQGLSNSQVCDEVYGLLRVKGCSENDVVQLKALGNALLPSVSLDEEEVPAYELEFNNIIESSQLDVRDKHCLAAAGSIYIHSAQYWY